MKIVWKEVQPKYGPIVDVAYIGSVEVGHVSLGLTDSEKYNANCYLPGLKKMPSYDTKNEAKENVEKRVEIWASAVSINGTNGHTNGYAGDWIEDFASENGNYQNKCHDCGKVFIGHKRRVQCKVCASSYEEKERLSRDKKITETVKAITDILDDWDGTSEQASKKLVEAILILRNAK